MSNIAKQNVLEALRLARPYVAHHDDNKSFPTHTSEVLAKIDAALTQSDAEPVAWERALNSACHQFESYVRQEKLTTPEDRRIALSDALQHAVGLLKIAAPPRPDASAGLIEAAGIVEQHIVQLKDEHVELWIIQVLEDINNELRARAADRSGK